MFHPGFMGKARVQLAQQSSAASTAQTVTCPSVQAGDLLVLFDVASNNVGGAVGVVPTGFTSIFNVTGGNVRAIASYKIAAGTEGGSSIFGMLGGISNNKMLYTFRGTPPILAVSAQGVNTEITSNNPSGQTIGSGSGIAPLIALACYRSTAAVDPRTFSPAKGGEINSSANAFLAYLIQNTTAANVSVDMDDEGDDNVLASFYLQCS